MMYKRLTSKLSLLWLAAAIIIASLVISMVPRGTHALAPAWAPNTAYAVNQLASYGGTDYKCIQAHTSLTGWEPPNVPALWTPQAGGGATATKTATTQTGPTNTPTKTATAGGPTNTPTKTATAGPTATKTPTTPISSGPLPKHVVTGYWHNFNNGSTALRLSSVPTKYGLVAVAFADANGTPGSVSFNIDSGLSSSLGGYTNAQFTADVDLLHSQGRKVIVSVGGQNGTISVADSTSANNFANAIKNLMTTFHFDGVDIDLENGVNPTYMSQALHSLRNMTSSNLIITMAPETIYMLNANSTYMDLAIRIKDILTIVNTQYYNSGAMTSTCDAGMGVWSQGTVNFMTALACTALTNGLRPDQVGLGLPATSAAAGGGYVAPSVVNAALDCLTMGTNCGTFRPPATYPTLRGAMTWSINWDATASYNWVNTVQGHFSALP
jgi:chitinase